MRTEEPSSFIDLVAVTSGSESDHFVGARAPEQGGRTYGGQLLAQAVDAAFQTVDPDRMMSSLHALFLRPGAVDEPTQWAVDRVRDGRSFATREVSGFQFDKELFRVIVSLQAPEPGLEFEPDLDFDIASLPQPEDVTTTYIDFCRAHPDVGLSEWSGEDRPIEILYIDPPDPTGGEPTQAPQRTWMRITAQLPDDPRLHQSGLAYLADATLIDHVMLPHGFRWHDERLTGASLDHAMWFHQPCRADEWLLYDQRVEATSSARGLATGRFYTRAGQLVATCVQEGLIRWADAP